MDLGSFVDTVAAEPSLGGRCVLVLTQRLPMAAFYLRGRLDSPADLVNARYGGPAESKLLAEHRALLRRLGPDDGSHTSPPAASADADPSPALHVDMPYEELFGALAEGRIDVAPDFGGIATRYRRAVGPEGDVGVLRYRDCGLGAYGIGFVASARGLAEQPDEIAGFLAVAADAYQRMRTDPESMIETAASRLPGLDREYTLAEWQDEEAPLIFGYEASQRGIAAGDLDGWRETVAWRQEVTGIPDTAPADRLFRQRVR